VGSWFRSAENHWCLYFLPGDALVLNSSQSFHGCYKRESAETLKQFGTLPRPSQPLGLRLTYAPACRKRAPTSASSLSLDGEGVSPSNLRVAFFALKTRTHRPAAQASSSSSSVHGCPHACAAAAEDGLEDVHEAA